MADNKPTRLPKDFNQNKVDDIEITDPVGAALNAAGIGIDREYPKHLHKFAGAGLMHEFVEVKNAKEEALQRKQGFVSIQEANADARAAEDADEDDAPAAPKAPKAVKPRKAKAVKGESAAN